MQAFLIFLHEVKGLDLDGHKRSLRHRFKLSSDSDNDTGMPECRSISHDDISALARAWKGCVVISWIEQCNFFYKEAVFER